jgi:hypothetical protein
MVTGTAKSGSTSHFRLSLYSELKAWSDVHTGQSSFHLYNDKFSVFDVYLHTVECCQVAKIFFSPELVKPVFKKILHARFK